MVQIFFQPEIVLLNHPNVRDVNFARERVSKMLPCLVAGVEVAILYGSPYLHTDLFQARGDFSLSCVFGWRIDDDVAWGLR